MRIILLAVLISFFFATPARAEEDEYAVKREKAEKHTQKLLRHAKPHQEKIGIAALRPVCAKVLIKK